MCAKSLHLCLSLCDPMDCTLPGFSVHGVLQEGRRGGGRSASSVCNLFCFMHSFPKPLVTYINIFLIWFLL